MRMPALGESARIGLAGAREAGARAEVVVERQPEHAGRVRHARVARDAIDERAHESSGVAPVLYFCFGQRDR